MSAKEQTIDIETEDGRVLSGLLVEPQEPRMTIVISSAVAIPKERYLNFAKAGVDRGAAVLMYDYRSQGASVRGDIREDLADFSHWGRLDMPAAIRCLDERYPDLEMAGLHHSVGGWIMGLADNHDRLCRNAFVCAGWGYWKLKPLPFRYVEMFFWHLYGPSCIKLFGHIPQGGLWKGTPLNPRLFANWKEWCHSAECSPAVLAGGAEQPHHYDEVRAPIRSFGYRDDPIANGKTVPLVLAQYPNAQTEEVWAAPGDFGLPAIGHEGLFSRKASKAWTPVWDWLLESS